MAISTVKGSPEEQRLAAAYDHYRAMAHSLLPSGCEPAHEVRPERKVSKSNWNEPEPPNGPRQAFAPVP